MATDSPITIPKKKNQQIATTKAKSMHKTRIKNQINNVKNRESNEWSKKVLILRKRKAKREMQSIAFDCSKIETDGCFKRNRGRLIKKKRKRRNP